MDTYREVTKGIYREKLNMDTYREKLLWILIGRSYHGYL